MEQIDIYRAANLIIQQHGKGAKAHAVQRILELHEANDLDGEWVWMGVFDAVLELEALGPEGDDLLH